MGLDQMGLDKVGIHQNEYCKLLQQAPEGCSTPDISET